MITNKSVMEIIAEYTEKKQADTRRQQKVNAFITTLKSYIAARKKQAPVSHTGELLLDTAFTIFGTIAGLSAKVKISAAQKMIRAVQGAQDIYFTAKELEALATDRLGIIIEENRDLLPMTYLQQEAAKSWYTLTRLHW